MHPIYTRLVARQLNPMKNCQPPLSHGSRLIQTCRCLHIIAVDCATLQSRDGPSPSDTSMLTFSFTFAPSSFEDDFSQFDKAIAEIARSIVQEDHA